MGLSNLPVDVHRDILATVNDNDFSTSFPGGGQLPPLVDLAHYNAAGFRRQRMNPNPQLPPALGAGCSRVDHSEVQMVENLGYLFQVVTRGGRLSPAGAASINYGLSLGATFMQAIVHSCTAQAMECRSEEFQRKEDWGVPVLPDLIAAMRERGVVPQNMRIEPGSIPASDLLHAHARAALLLSRSNEVVNMIAQGKLIFGEGWYDEKSGKIHWIRFWRGGAVGREFPAGIVQAIVDGKLTHKDYEVGLHPSLQTLNALVFGNNRFVEGFKAPVPTEVVAFGCADSRMSSRLFSAPFGLVEWVRNAGNLVDDLTLKSIRIAAESAERNLRQEFERSKEPKFGDPVGYIRPATLLVLSHTGCGAINAALSQKHSEDGGHQVEGIEHITAPISRRLERYRCDHPHPEETDLYHAVAARENALGSCLDILFPENDPTNPDAAALRELVMKDRLIVTPARVSLKRGVAQMFPSITSEQLKRLLPYI